MKQRIFGLLALMIQAILGAQNTNIPPIRYLKLHDTDIIKNNNSVKKIKSITSYITTDSKRQPSLTSNYNENGDLIEVISYENSKKNKVTTYQKNNNETREKNEFYKTDGTKTNNYIETVRTKNPTTNKEIVTLTYYPDKNSQQQEILYNANGKVLELKDYQYDRVVRSTGYLYQDSLLTKEIFSAYQYTTPNQKPKISTSEVVYKYDKQGNMLEILSKDHYLFFYKNNKLVKEQYNNSGSLKFDGEINYIYNSENKVIKIQERLSNGCKMESNIEYDKNKFKKVISIPENNTQYCYFRYATFMPDDKQTVYNYAYDSNNNLIQFITEKNGKTVNMYEYEIQYF